MKPHLEDSLSSARGKARQTFEMIHNEHENLDFEDIKIEFEDSKKQHAQSRVSAAQTRAVIPKPLSHPLHTDTSDPKHPTMEDANVDSLVHLKIINPLLEESTNHRK